MHYIQKERIVRDSYNTKYKASTEKKCLRVGNPGVKHEYDIFEKGKIIAGVSTSPWKNKSGTNNTGGQDRASAELLWLSLWDGKEERWHILTDNEMAERIFKKFRGTSFRKKVFVYHFDLNTRVFTCKGELG